MPDPQPWGPDIAHHWQDFRPRKDRTLKTRSDCGWRFTGPGPHRVCVKVIDVFGVDTAQVIEAVPA
jgi:adenine-specific DNA-methyltransferase